MRSQIAAMFGTADRTMLPAVQFSGLIDPVSSLEGVGALDRPRSIPTTHFLTICRGHLLQGAGLRRPAAVVRAAADRRAGADRAVRIVLLKKAGDREPCAAANICNLGVKELRSLVRDPMMLVLIVYAFTVSIYVAATAMPETLNKAPIAIVDEDRSPLSARIVAPSIRRISCRRR